ncbi:MAG: hypothetical protein AAGI50_12545 [Pseudomonadota bacterium]
MMFLDRERSALYSAFALNGIGIAVWFPRIPDVKAALDLDLLTLSLCFLMLPTGTLIGFAYAAPLIARVGGRRVVAWCGGAFILAFILPAVAWSAATLAISLFVTGLAIAPIEVGMNAKASAFEASRGRRVMTQCHAMWSFGAMAGALVAGAFADNGVSFLVQQLVLAPPLAAAAIVAGLNLASDRPGVQLATPRFALPSRGLLALAALPIGALLLEGAMMEWSALYLQGEVGLTAGRAAAAFAAFSLAMGVARLLGDSLATAIGPVRVIRASSYLACGGLVAFATAFGPITATAGALLLGLGVANIYPLALSMAATEAPSGQVERSIAALTFAAFSAFLIGPPLIGALASIVGLGGALLLLVPLAVYPPTLLKEGVQARLEAAR